MSFKDIETNLKETLYSILKGRTKIYLDYIDAIKMSETITKSEDKNLESIKSRGKQMFLEIQDELLNSIKNIVDTGSSPKGTDTRGSASSQNKL